MIRVRMTENGHVVVEAWTPDGDTHVADLEIEDSGDALNRVIYVRLERIGGEMPQVRFHA